MLPNKEIGNAFEVAMVCFLTQANLLIVGNFVVVIEMVHGLLMVLNKTIVVDTNHVSTHSPII